MAVSNVTGARLPVMSTEKQSGLTSCQVDDASPLVIYDPADAWVHTSGSDAQSYGNSTFSSAQTEGATVKLSFTGTGFWVYGATKPDYGQYILMLDNQVMLYANATSDQPQFGQVLGGSSGLADGEHEVMLMSAGGGLVDFDSIMFETTDQQSMYVPVQSVCCMASVVLCGGVASNEASIVCLLRRPVARLRHRVQDRKPSGVSMPGRTS